MSVPFDFLNSPVGQGLSVIEASAGTGKTFAICHLVPRLLLDATVSDVSQILLVTFTNDAAAELSGRVRKVLENLDSAARSGSRVEAAPGVKEFLCKYSSEQILAVTGRALLNLDRMSICTIHAFCLQMIQQEGFLCGLPVLPELVPDASAQIERATAELWKEISADRLLSLVSMEQQWRMAEDVDFFRLTIPELDLNLVPTPESFEGWRNRLTMLLSDFREEDNRTFCGSIPHDLTTNRAYADIYEKIGPLSAALVGAKDKVTREVFEALRMFCAYESWFNKGKKAAKEWVKSVECDPFLASCRELSSHLQVARWSFRASSLPRIRAAVEEDLGRERLITYDGLLDVLHRALKGGEGAALAREIAGRYHVALIDESQDTDRRQFEIFQSIFLNPAHPRRLVMIGDPKQAIYAFRGADVNTYLAARELAPETQRFTLTTTYRAPAALVETVNALFRKEDSFLKEGLKFYPAFSGLDSEIILEVPDADRSAPMEVWVVPDDEESMKNAGERLQTLADAVAAETSRLLNANAKIQKEESVRPVEPRDIAVLVSTNGEAACLRDALRRKNIPAVVASPASVMESAEASDLLHLLEAISNPRDLQLVRGALIGNFFEKSFEDLAEGQETKLEVLYSRFSVWKGVWESEGISALLARVDREEGISTRLAAQQDGERKLTNLRQLADLLQTRETADSFSPQALLRWLKNEIAGEESQVAEEKQQKLESDSSAVQIVTMHKAKGLEFPLVFCPFLWSFKEVKGFQKFRYPSGKTEFFDCAAGAVGEHFERASRAAFEDRLRLVYVALTRAQVKLWVVCGETSGKGRGRTPASALDWLLWENQTVAADFSTWKEQAELPGRGARHRRAFEELIEHSGNPGLFSVRDLPKEESGPWQQDPKENLPALAALPAPEIPAGWRMTSFSAFTREKHPHGSRDGDRPLPGEFEPVNLFSDAPGGSMVGTALHDWMEAWDFGAVDGARLEHHLRAYGLPEPETPPDLSFRVAQMLEQLRGVQLPGWSRDLRQLCGEPSASEWHFQLPVTGELSPALLAGIFKNHGLTEYSERLSSLPTEALTGYLHGFIDRIVFSEDRWGVIDWKTNRLGTSAQEYREEALLDCAHRSHYFLQCCFYLLALRRYAGLRATICGASLVFLRGIRAGTSDGVLTVAPPDDLLREMEEIFQKVDQ